SPADAAHASSCAAHPRRSTPPAPPSLAPFHKLRRRREDLHKPRRRAHKNPHHLDPVGVEVPIQQHPGEPPDHAAGRQRQRQLQPRPRRPQAPKAPAAPLRLVPLIGHPKPFPPAPAAPPLADILKPHTYPSKASPCIVQV